jgi:hypothetical protein
MDRAGAGGDIKIIFGSYLEKKFFSKMTTVLSHPIQQ